MAEPSEQQLWRGVEHTVRHVLLPAIDDEWARATAIQLVGLARYAATRPGGRAEANVAELTEALAGLGGNPIVAAAAADSNDVLAVAGAALAAAVYDDGPDGDEVRTVLRPVVVRQLADELAVTAALVPFFRGEIDDG